MSFKIIPIIILVNFIVIQTKCSAHVNPFLPRVAQRHIERKLESVFYREPPENVTQPAFNPSIIMQNLLPFFMRDLIGSVEAKNLIEIVRERLVEQRASLNCVADITQLFSAVLIGSQQELPSTWALHMMDSWGKMPSGIFSGNVMAPGDFLECINVRGSYTAENSSDNVSVKGSYCSTYLMPGPYFDSWLDNGTTLMNSDGHKADTKDAVSVNGLLKHMLDPDRIMILPFMGSCFPATCTVNDVQTILTTFYDVATSGTLNQVALGCVTDEKLPLRIGHYAMIAVLTVIISLCIVGTVYDMEHDYRCKHGDDEDLSLPMKILMAFSLQTNTKKWLTTRPAADNLGCLHGLRTLSMAWIILAHTWGMVGFQFNWNMIGVVEWYKNWSYFPILNGTVSVDTFFTMSGALVSYNILRELDRRRGRLNYPLLVLHRYLRITPTYAIIIGMMATLLPYVGWGPNWYAVEMESKGCEVNWWHNVLYINNLMKYDDSNSGECYPESWYLANDMQFFVLAPFVIYPLWRLKYLGYLLLILLSIASIISPTYIMEREMLEPTLSPFSVQYANFMEKIYTKPWARCGPYVTGLILGYVLYRRTQSPAVFENMPKRIVLWGWSLSTVAALLIIYAPMSYFDPDNAEMSRTAWHSHLYGGIHRYLWGGVISWIIFACVNGNAGAINTFLSWKVFMPLGRLTFCMYISSYHLQITYHMSQSLHPVHVSPYSVVYLFLAHFVAGGFVAFILMITLESPFIQIEKLLFHAPKKSNKTQKEKPELSKEPPLNMEKCETNLSFGWFQPVSEVAGFGEKPAVLFTAARAHPVV